MTISTDGVGNPYEKIVDMRRRINRGEDVTDEEIRDGIAALFAFRNKTFAKPKEPKAPKEKATKARGSAAPKMTKAAAISLLEDLL